ncbi:cold shock domain-containing protein C2 isoform X1 [Ammospiza nelsoni]|uniref:cold shock domain-containing protein C2 isoform X1 n=1 Tax=Ammospiza nelsoni TaxID=2857394 RepID=UPI00286B95E7|nr:cold shock domain-containing protein C2 isoform X1 [Ammospiza nelsoni]
MSSEPSAPPAVPPLHSPKSPVWPTFPFQREGSRIWERGNLLLRDLPSPLPTKRTRTYSATARASAGPIFKGVCKQFSRSQGHGFITPENGTEDIFVHVSEAKWGQEQSEAGATQDSRALWIQEDHAGVGIAPGPYGPSHCQPKAWLSQGLWQLWLRLQACPGHAVSLAKANCWIFFFEIN